MSSTDAGRARRRRSKGFAGLADDALDRAFHVVMRAADELIDAAYGVDTRRELRYDADAAHRTRHVDPSSNMPSYYLRLFALRRFLRPQAGDAVVDLGCGDGRALCVFARCGVDRVVGLDFDAGACAAARQNARALRRRRARVEVVLGDAAEYPFSDETIVYLFNPFGGATLRSVLRNLHDSLRRRPRRVRICYYHPHQEAVIAATPWLRRAATLRGIKTDIVIYETVAQ